LRAIDEIYACLARAWAAVGRDYLRSQSFDFASFDGQNMELSRLAFAAS